MRKKSVLDAGKLLEHLLERRLSRSDPSAEAVVRTWTRIPHTVRRALVRDDGDAESSCSLMRDRIFPEKRSAKRKSTAVRSRRGGRRALAHHTSPGRGSTRILRKNVSEASYRNRRSVLEVPLDLIHLRLNDRRIDTMRPHPRERPSPFFDATFRDEEASCQPIVHSCSARRERNLRDSGCKMISDEWRNEGGGTDDEHAACGED